MSRSACGGMENTMRELRKKKAVAVPMRRGKEVMNII